jgi:hypothetical protein
MISRAALLFLLVLAMGKIALGAEPRSATKPATADRVPEGWDALDIGKSALMGREKDGIKPEEFQAKILTWRIEEDKRPLYIESCVVWIKFVNLDHQPTWRLGHLYRHSKESAWSFSWVTDVGYWNHADFKQPPTNKQVYEFLKETWWTFGEHEEFVHNDEFILLDCGVCANTWKDLTGEPPSKFYAQTQVLLRGKGDLESAPHGKGNVYAPEVLFEDNSYRMWYGGQGKDGHDRIFYAESADGLRWTCRGVAVEDATANHVNDPSVVKVADTYYMFFTRAAAGVVDEIALATSDDGRKWKPRGTVLTHGAASEWDALSVGRPSVMREDGVFKLWYDGRKDLPPSAPATGVAKSSTSARSVGYAASRDGLHWKKYERNPVIGHDFGGVDVKRVGNRYVMACESQRGTRLATSADGLTWSYHGPWVLKSENWFEAHGNVTPCLLVRPDRHEVTLYFGAAASIAWDHNSIAVHKLTGEELAALNESREQ